MDRVAQSSSSSSRAPQGRRSASNYDSSEELDYGPDDVDAGESPRSEEDDDVPVVATLVTSLCLCVYLSVSLSLCLCAYVSMLCVGAVGV